MINGILWVKLTKEARNALLELCPPKHEKMFADHVTLLYNINFDSIPDELFDSKIDIKLKQEKWDTQIQAVGVELPQNIAHMVKNAHITISAKQDVPPVRSGKLFESELVEARSLTGDIEIEGFVEFFEFKQRVN